VKTAQVRLGHASPITTLRIYAQATPRADKEAAERLGDLFRPDFGRAHRAGMRDGCAMDDASSDSTGEDTAPEQDFLSGARWTRTTDLSIISAAVMCVRQGADQRFSRQRGGFRRGRDPYVTHW
jgi:hypothetical protein